MVDIKYPIISDIDKTLTCPSWRSSTDSGKESDFREYEKFSMLPGSQLHVYKDDKLTPFGKRLLKNIRGEVWSFKGLCTSRYAGHIDKNHFERMINPLDSFKIYHRLYGDYRDCHEVKVDMVKIILATIGVDRITFVDDKASVREALSNHFGSNIQVVDPAEWQ